MRVKMPLWVRLTVGRRLVEAHRVWKAGGEQIVEARGHALERLGQPVALDWRKLRHGAAMAAAHDHDFERPHRPPWHQRGEVLIFKNNALAGGAFSVNVLAKQAAAGARQVLALCCSFSSRLVGDKIRRPDL